MGQRPRSRSKDDSERAAWSVCGTAWGRLLRLRGIARGATSRRSESPRWGQRVVVVSLWNLAPGKGASFERVSQEQNAALQLFTARLLIAPLASQLWPAPRASLEPAFGCPTAPAGVVRAFFPLHVMGSCLAQTVAAPRGFASRRAAFARVETGCCRWLRSFTPEAPRRTTFASLLFALCKPTTGFLKNVCFEPGIAQGRQSVFLSLDKPMGSNDGVTTAENPQVVTYVESV